MSAEFIVTIGDVSNFKGLFNGIFLKGRREPRVAIVGRSNVGKSTLINAMVGQRVAQTSNTPGKTRAIHCYLWKEKARIIADLPGYGYAQAAKTERERWEKFIKAYLDQDPNLERIIILIDARYGPTDTDMDAVDYFKRSRIPLTLVFSKLDTLKTQSERAKRRKEGTQALVDVGIPSEDILWVSAKTRENLNFLAQKVESG
jgi:GTP-binding protein